jgi:hypothetical protein
MLGLKGLYVEGELHVKVISFLTDTLVKRVTAIETLNIHSTDFTLPHKDTNMSHDRSHLVSMCRAIGSLPFLKHLSLRS